MPAMQLPGKLERFLTTPKRFKVAFGGRGAGKSQGFGQIFIMKAQTERAKTMCLRELQNSIDDSVHSLLREQITEMGLDENFQVTDRAIRYHGDDVFKFKGLARNPDAVKSMHGFKYAWGEEAQVFSEDSIRLLTPTIREAGSEIWLSLNPGSSNDPVSQRFLQPFYDELLTTGFYEDDQHMITWMNYYDNPWFPAELEAERQWDEDNLPRAVYRHIWLGHYLDEIDGSIIPVEWFDACIDAHEKLGWKPQGVKVVAHDPSDRGDDAKGLAYRHGSLVKDVTEYHQGDVNSGCTWATDYALAVDADHFTWDACGLGAGLRRQIGEALNTTSVEYSEFNGGMGVDYPERPYDPKAVGGKPKTNRETFKNKRAQHYWLLRDRFYNTFRAVTRGEYIDPDDMLSLSSSMKYLDKLRAEVCRIPLKPNANGMIQILSKDDLLRHHKIQSPNMADSLSMLWAPKVVNLAKRSVNIPTIKARRMSR